MATVSATRWLLGERPLRVAGVAAWLLASSVVALSLTIWLARGSPRLPMAYADGPLGTSAVAMTALVYATVAIYLMGRLPRNPIGWIFMSIGLGMALLLPIGLALADPVRGYRPLDDPLLWPAWALTSVQLPAAGLGLVLVLSLLPSAHPRWPDRRALALVAAAGAGLMAIAAALLPDGLVWYPTLPNPLDVPAALRPLLRVAMAAGTALLVGALATAEVWLLRRAREADEGEQRQLVWVVTGGLLMGATLTPLFVARYIVGVEHDLGERLVFVAALGGVSFPLLVAVACRHAGLFGFRELIGRSLVYLPLMALLAGLFAAATALLQRVFVAFTGTTSDAAIILATLLVVASLTPARQALESIVKRLTEGTPEDAHGGGEGGWTRASGADLVDRLARLEARLCALEGRLAPPATGGAAGGTCATRVCRPSRRRRMGRP